MGTHACARTLLPHLSKHVQTHTAPPRSSSLPSPAPRPQPVSLSPQALLGPGHPCWLTLPSGSVHSMAHPRGLPARSPEPQHPPQPWAGSP